MSSLVVECPRGHGPLHAVTLSGKDAARAPVGACSICGGLWMAADVVPLVFPAEQLAQMATVGVSGRGPDCTRCPGVQLLQTQVVNGVALDRCPECAGMWLDGGELGALLDDSDPGCVACGATRAEGLALCGSCASLPQLEESAVVEMPFGLGGQAGDRTFHTSVDGNKVVVSYDEHSGGTMLSWVGHLSACPLKLSVGYETALTRLLGRVGLRDLQVGEPRFDAMFLLDAVDPELALRVLERADVQSALMELGELYRATVEVTTFGVIVTGATQRRFAPPDPAFEHAATTLFRAVAAL